MMIKTSQNHWQLDWSFNNLFMLTTNNRAPHYWSFVRGIHMWPMDSLTKAVDVESWRNCPGGLSHKFRKNHDIMTWISLRKGQQLGNNFHGTTTSYVKMMTLLQHFHCRYRVWNHIEIKICIYLNSTVFRLICSWQAMHSSSCFNINFLEIRALAKQNFYGNCFDCVRFLSTGYWLVITYIWAL